MSGILTLLLIVLAGDIQAQNSIQFSGYVFNGSRDSTALVDADVELYLMTEQTTMPSRLQTTRTDSQGKFSFILTQADTAAIYAFATHHQGVQYFSHALKLSASQDRIQHNVVVYDTTTSTSGMTVFMHHLFLEDDGRSIMVRETIIPTNLSNKTIAAAVREDGVGEAVLKFRLPESAQNFRPMERNARVDLIRIGGFVYDRGVFAPGNRQISYVYQIPWRRNVATASLEIT